MKRPSTPPFWRFRTIAQRHAKTVITFRERPAGEPEALRAWFIPAELGRGIRLSEGAQAICAKPRPQHAGPLHAGRGPRRSCRADPVGGPSRCSDTEECSRYGHSTTGEEVALAQVVTPPPAGTKSLTAAHSIAAATAGSCPADRVAWASCAGRRHCSPHIRQTACLALTPPGIRFSLRSNRPVRALGHPRAELSRPCTWL